MAPRAAGAAAYSVEHDEIVDCTDVTSAGDTYTSFPEFARVGLTFVSERIVLGGDDESIGQPLELIKRCVERRGDYRFAGRLVRQIGIPEPLHRRLGEPRTVLKLCIGAGFEVLRQ